jgi:hypothetical protein
MPPYLDSPPIIIEIIALNLAKNTSTPNQNGKI